MSLVVRSLSPLWRHFEIQYIVYSSLLKYSNWLASSQQWQRGCIGRGEGVFSQSFGHSFVSCSTHGCNPRPISLFFSPTQGIFNIPKFWLILHAAACRLSLSVHPPSVPCLTNRQCIIEKCFWLRLQLRHRLAAICDSQFAMLTGLSVPAYNSLEYFGCVCFFVLTKHQQQIWKLKPRNSCYKLMTIDVLGLATNWGKEGIA